MLEMMQLGGRGHSARPSSCLNRRSFLKIGALTLGGLTLPNLLRVRQAQAAHQRKQTSAIFLWMHGGPSHIDTYDMKPDAVEEVRGPFQPIETNLPGLQVCHLMPGHAKIADRLAVVRSLHHEYGVHDDANHLVQTGYPQLNARQNGQNHPCIGSIVSHLGNVGDRQMPPYVCIPEDYRNYMGFYESAAFLDAQHNALNGGGDPSLGNFRPPDFALPDGIDLDRLESRSHLLRQLDAVQRSLDNNSQVRDLDDINQQALQLICGNKARDAFDISQEPDAMKEKYGRHAWGKSTLLARRLVEAGVSFVTVNFFEKDVDWWDDHYTLEKNLRARLPVYDQVLCALIDDLHQRGLSEEVLVIACGEFGRAPRIDAGGGRGHWPRAMHAVLSGAGVKEGQIIGSTTRDGGEPKDRPLTPGDLLASIYELLGIDYQSTVLDRQNRPVPIIQQGEPIRELFA